MGDDLVEVAVLRDEGTRLLGADAGHAGDVVGRVALEAVEVGHELRRDAVVQVIDALGRHDGDVGQALAGGHHVHVVGHELIHIAVTGDEVHVAPGGLTAAGKSPQNVVALPALELHDGNGQTREQLLDHGELTAQVGIHGRALRLILRQHLHADLRTTLVEGADHAVGRELVDHFEEHVEEAEHRVGGAAVRRVHGRRHGMEGAVHERVAVDHGDDAALAGGSAIGHGDNLISSLNETSLPHRMDLLPRVCKRGRVQIAHQVRCVICTRPQLHGKA